MNDLKERIEMFLMKKGDEARAKFDQKLISTKYKICGISTRTLEEFAKVLAKEEVDINRFSFYYHEEILLAGMVLARQKNSPSVKIEKFSKLLPYIDNWATCDMIVGRLKGLESEAEFFINLLSSDNVFYVRVGVVWMMKYMLKSDTKKSIQLLKNRIKINDYYIEMALAWFFAEALIYDFDYVLNELNNLKNENVKRFAYSKACDSYRINNDKKEIIRALRKK